MPAAPSKSPNVITSHAIILKEGGEMDAHLSRVIIAGLHSAYNIQVPANARVVIMQDSPDGGLGHVSVNWSESARKPKS